jgi:DNA-binding LacI/PurR family transcriptional regulator
MSRTQRVTGRDVAERAGVSRATVSYVLNDAAGQVISAATRARVLAAAEELGYTPHAAARQLRTGQSDLVLLALPPWPLSHAFNLCVAAFSQRLGELGYTALVDAATMGIAHLEHTLSRVQPVALVASADHLSEPLVARLRAAGTRAVFGIGDRPLDFAPAVVFDQRAVTCVAVDHLASRGHRSVLAIMPSDPAFAWFRAGREAGALTAAAAHELALNVVDCPLDRGAVAGVVARALENGSRPDAILAYNDDYAFLVMDALVDAGVRVPDDIAVIGCDDVPVAELFRPRLTSVTVDMGSWGSTIADVLHDALRSGEGPDVIHAPTPVVVERDSA